MVVGGFSLRSLISHSMRMRKLLPSPCCTPQNKHAESAGGVADNIDLDTHKAGMEPAAERQRNLTDVAMVRQRRPAAVHLTAWTCLAARALQSTAPAHAARTAPPGTPPFAGEDAHRGDGGDAHP